MRFLLNIAESTMWAKYSAPTFIVLFLGLIYMVFRPSAKPKYDSESRIVFDDGIKK